MERTAVVDADGAYIPCLYVLEGRRAGAAGADHRRPGAVDLDVPEVDIRDRVQVLHAEVGDQHDRVVGVIEEVVAGNLDVRVDAPLQRVDPDGAEADLPVQLERPGPHSGVVGDQELPGDWLGAEAGADLDGAAFTDRVGYQVAGHGVVGTAIEGDAVREHRGLNGVVVEHIVR